MSKPNVGKKKVAGPHNIKKHQPKKEYSLRSKHNIKTATVSEISHSGERAQHTLNEERLISGQSKNPSVFAKPNNPNLKANDGNKYYHANSQVVRYGYDHQADNQYVNGYDHADYQCSGNEHNHRADDQYGGCTSNQADNEGYGFSRRTGSNERHHFYSNGSYIYRKYFWGNNQNNTDTDQSKQNQFFGKGGMNVYNAGVIRCDYIPYTACFTGMYYIIPLFR